MPTAIQQPNDPQTPVQPTQQPQPQPQQPMQFNTLQQPPQGQSVEGNGLNGNKQQVNNFMNALNQVGAGSNNTFMNSQNPNQSPQINPLVNPNAVGANNGSTNPNYMYQNGQFVPGSAPNVAPTSNNNINPNNVLQFNPNNETVVQSNSNPANILQFNPANEVMAPTNINPNNVLQFNPNNQVVNTPNPFPYSFGGNYATAATSQQSGPSASDQTAQTLGWNPNMKIVSDENLKTNITTAKHSVENFLSSIKAHNYEYKDKQDGVGTFTSPMAQELEKTDLGKQAVINTPRGKMVDYARLGGVNLAAVSVVHRENQRLQKQIDELRKLFHKRK